MNEQREFLASSFFGFSLSILILGVLLFIALVQRSAGLASLAGTVLLLMVGTRLWTRIAPYRLSLLFRIDRHRLFPGEAAKLEVTLRNAKPLPFYLSIEGPFHLLGQTIVRPFSELHHAWNIPLTKRGVYPLRACTLSFGDPFGLSSTRRTLPLHEEIVVYPRLKRIEGSIAQFQEFFGLHPAKGLVDDPAWYAGTRDYTGSRPARFIHWKASARIGKIQEKIFEPTSHAKILVIVKVEGFARELCISARHARTARPATRFSSIDPSLRRFYSELLRSLRSLHRVGRVFGIKRLPSETLKAYVGRIGVRYPRLKQPGEGIQQMVELFSYGPYSEITDHKGQHLPLKELVVARRALSVECIVTFIDRWV